MPDKEQTPAMEIVESLNEEINNPFSDPSTPQKLLKALEALAYLYARADKDDQDHVNELLNNP